MKIQLTNTNSKGQLVIPKKFRDELNIDEEKTLMVSLIPGAVVIRPIVDVVVDTSDKTAYLDLLKKTRGSWITKDSGKKKKGLELRASKKRKSAW